MLRFISFALVALAVVGVAFGLSNGNIAPSPMVIADAQAGALELPDFDVGDAISAAVVAFGLLAGLPRLLALLGQVAVYFSWLSPELVRPITNLILGATFVGIFVASIFGGIPVILQMDNTLGGFVGLLAQLLVLVGIPISQESFRHAFRLPESKFR